MRPTTPGLLHNWLPYCVCCTSRAATTIWCYYFYSPQTDWCASQHLVWLALSFLQHRKCPVVHLRLTGVDWVQVLLDSDAIWRLLSLPLETQGQIRNRLFVGIQKAPFHTSTPSPCLFLRIATFWQPDIHAHGKYRTFYLCSPRLIPPEENDVEKVWS